MIADLMVMAGVATLIVLAGWIFLAPDKDHDGSPLSLPFFDTTDWSDLDESSHHDPTRLNQ